jgi:hypothetical protein
MASGFTAAQTGRTHDRTRPMLQQLRKFLPRRRRPHITQSGHEWPLLLRCTVQPFAKGFLGERLAGGG